jgi:hypothetical protein
MTIWRTPAEIAVRTWPSKNRVRAARLGANPGILIAGMPAQSRRWASGSPSGVYGRVRPDRVSATAWLVRDGPPAGRGLRRQR